MSGIEWVKQTEQGIELLCDCGAVTVLVGDGDEAGVKAAITAPGDLETISVTPAGGEVAFTCICGSNHWLTFSPSEGQS